MTSTSLLFILQNLQSVRFCEGAAGEAYFNIRDGLFATNQGIEDIPNFERKNVKENSDGTISVTYHGTRPVINRDESYDDEDYFDVTFRLVRDDNNVF